MFTVGVMFNFPDQATVKKVVNCLPRVGIGATFGLPQTRYFTVWINYTCELLFFFCEFFFFSSNQPIWFKAFIPPGLQNVHTLKPVNSTCFLDCVYIMKTFGFQVITVISVCYREGSFFLHVRLNHLPYLSKIRFFMVTNPLKFKTDMTDSRTD